MILNGIEYKTKKSAKIKIKSIIDRYSPNSILVGDDFRTISDLIKYHPDSRKKIGPGINGIVVLNVPPYYNSKGFSIIRTDGSQTDFSYNKCLGVSVASKTKFSRAARTAIGQTMIEFKRNIFSGNKTLVCPMTGKQITPGTCHIDHAPPYYFSKIVDMFLLQNRIDVDLVKYKKRGDGSVVIKFDSDDLGEAFIHFHNKLATLRAVDAGWNLKSGNRSKT